MIAIDRTIITYLIPYLISFCISLSVAIYSHQRRSIPGAFPFFLAALCQAGWTLGFIIELLTITIEGKIFWDNLQWIFMGLVPIFILGFVLSYTHQKLKNGRIIWGVLVLIPLVNSVLTLTDKYHGWVREDTRLIHGVPFSDLIYSYDPFGSLILIHFGAVTVLVLIILIRKLIYPGLINRTQLLAILIGQLIPVVGIVVAMAGIQLTFHRDASPLYFAASNLVMAWGLFRFRLFSIVPIARDKVVDTIDEAVFVVDAGNMVLDANPAASKFLEKEPTDIVEKSLRDAFGHWMIKLGNHIDATEGQFEIQVGTDEYPRFIELKIYPLLNRQQQLTGRILVSRDITERIKAAETLSKANEKLELTVKARTRKLEETNLKLFREMEEHRQTANELRSSEKRYRELVENIDDIFFTMDLDGRFTYVSPVIKTWLGYASEQFIERHGSTIIESRILNDIISDLKADPEKKIDPLEFTVNDASGEDFWVRLNIRSIMVEEQLAGFQGVLSNITERKRSQEMMIQSEKMISVGGLAAGMAHEINNPLGVIALSVNNIKKRLSPDLDKNRSLAKEIGIDVDRLFTYLKERNVLASLDMISESNKRAIGIITNMLQFSRKSESELAPARVDKIIRKTLELAANNYDLEQNYDFRAIHIVEEIEEGLPELNCAETQIEQVILNLLANASHAMADQNSQNPMIIVRAAATENTIRIEVEDNGPGIKESTRKRIFEPFFTTKAVGKGTGLGLAVSYMIITQNHNGTIHIESSPGKGSCFVIQLPIQPHTRSIHS